MDGGFERRTDGADRTTTRVFTLSPGGALLCSRHPRGKGERWHGDILPYNWNTFRKQRERRETFHFLRKTYEKWIRVRSQERGGGKERRIAGEYRVRCRSSAMRMGRKFGRVGTGMGTLSNIPELQYWISSEADPIERKRNATQDEWGH